MTPFTHRSQSVLDYPWSSASGGHALLPTRRPPWLASVRALAAYGFADTAAGRRRWVKRLDDRAKSEAREQCGIPSPPEGHDARRSDLRRGWYWGSQTFAERMLKLGEKVLQKARHRRGVASPEKSAHGEQEALRLVEEGMKLAGLTEDDLVRLPGSHPRKVAIARRVWQETTVNLRWISDHLHLRSAANASQQILRQRQAPPELPKPLQKWLTQSIKVA